MSDQNPHPGDMRHSQIPVCCLIPPPLRLDIDRCINTDINNFFVIQICQPLNKDNSHCMDLFRWQNAKYHYITFQFCEFHCILILKKFSKYEIIGLQHT